MGKKRSNKMIEFMRFISCVFVCFIHCPFPAPAGRYVTMIGRYAVPFFILLSGYFSYNANPIAKAKKKLVETLQIVLVGGIVCLIWNSINSYLEFHDFTKWFQQYLKVETILKLLLFNRAVFLNSVFYYFFLMIYTYFIFIIACKTNTVKYFYFLIPFLLLMLFIVATKGKWFMGGNWLFLGLPMFFLGHFLHSHPQIITSTKGKEYLLIITGVMLTLVENSLKIHTDYIYLGSIVMAVACLCLCINRGQDSCPSIFATIGTNYSLYIMILHCEVRDTLRIFISNQSYYFPVLVLCVTVFLSALAKMVIDSIRTKKVRFAF